MDSDFYIRKRFKELAEKSYKENRFVFTDFLNEAQLSSFYSMENELKYAGTKVFGGHPMCERCMVRFGLKDAFGYDEDFPITILCIKPIKKKFADTLTHRDFLGAVMNLGINREKTGDIVINENEGYIFAYSGISEYIKDNLSSVKHTTVKINEVKSIPDYNFKQEEIVLNVNNSRADAIISKLYNMSREASLRCFVEGKVFINGINTTENAKRLKNNDKVSLRGFGKFVFLEELGVTKKGKQKIKIKRYI